MEGGGLLPTQMLDALSTGCRLNGAVSDVPAETTSSHHHPSTDLQGSEPGFPSVS